MRTQEEILKDFKKIKYEVKKITRDEKGNVEYCLLQNPFGIYIEFDVYKVVRKNHKDFLCYELRPKEIDLIYHLMKCWGWLK